MNVPEAVGMIFGICGVIVILLIFIFFAAQVVGDIVFPLMDLASAYLGKIGKRIEDKAKRIKHS